VIWSSKQSLLFYLSLTLVLFIYLGKKSDDLDDHKTEKNLFQDSYEVQLIRKDQKLVDETIKLKEFPAKNLNLFEKDQSILEATKVIDRINSYLDPQKKKVEFKESGLDNFENYSKALFFINSDYSRVLDASQVRKKVVSLKFFELSEFRTFVDCLHLMESVVKHVKSSVGGQTKKNLRLDLYEVSQICAKEDVDGTLRFKDSIDLHDLKEIIQMGVDYVQDV